MQNLWLIIIVFFLVLLILPIFVKAYVNFDFLNNIGVVSIRIFFMQVICYKIRYEKRNIVFYTSKEHKELEIKVSDKQMRFIKQLSVQLKEKVILKDIYFFSNIGVGDADKTAVLTGLVNAIFYTVIAKIKNIKKSASAHINYNANFNNYSFIISSNINCFITLFDLIYATFMSSIIIKRSEKYERVK